MPLFSIEKNRLIIAKLKDFKTEKELQSLIENNLDSVFNCKFIATEFATGPKHAGRIDTLALSEDSNPVIIEYKKVESSDLINQSLFYLSWLSDHRGDFEIVVHKVLGNNQEIDWSSIRVICIAPGYKKYDLHAVQMMGANIELWQYKIFDNNSFFLEEVFRKQSSYLPVSVENSGKNPKMVEAGKKAALTRASGSYTIEEHLNKAAENLKPLLLDLQSFILEIDDSIEEVPKKFYIAYKVAQNFVCIGFRQNSLILYLKLNPDDLEMKDNMRDVRNIGHHRGTGDIEISIENQGQLDEAKYFIKLAYDSIGG